MTSRAVMYLRVAALCTLALHPLAQAYELRATMVDFCPTTALPDGSAIEETLGTALLENIATNVAGSLFDKGVARLKAVVEPDSIPLAGNFLMDGLYVYKSVKIGGSDKPSNVTRINRQVGCLVIAASNFGPESDWVLPFPPDGGPEAAPAAVKKLRQVLGLSEPPAIYLEAAYHASPDKTGVVWQPVRLYVGDFLGNGFFRGKTRGLTVTVTMVTAGKTPFYTTAFKAASVSKGEVRGKDGFGWKASGSWGKLVAPTDSPDVVASEAGSPFDPFTLELELVEAPHPYPLVTTIFEAANTPTNTELVKTSIKEAIQPAVGESARQTKRDATSTALSNFMSAYGTAKEDCDSLKANDDKAALKCEISRDNLHLKRSVMLSACKAAPLDSCTKAEAILDVLPSAKS